MRKLETRIPTNEGFCTLPIRPPDGNLLAAACTIHSLDFTLISCDDEPRFEEVRDTGEGAMRGALSALVGDRFVVGLGVFMG